jgi:iron complex transport system permease protein
MLAMAALCASIGTLLARRSGTSEGLSGSEVRALRRATVLPERWPEGLAAPLLVLAVIAALVVSVQVGAVRVTAANWWALLHGDTRSGGAYVLAHLRLPRSLFAALAGAALGLCGAMTQGLFRNPLADPGLLGVTGGASCAAALVLTVFAGLQLMLPPAWRTWLLPAAAFGGAMAVCLALDRVARWLMPGSIAGLLLAGLALNAITMAIVGLASYLATDEQLRSLTFWTLGSLAGAGWTVALALACVLAACAWRAARLAHALNALALGEAVAGHVGINVARLRNELIVVIALLSAMVAAWCGFIGFIGLMAPHLVRGISVDQRRVLPLSMAAGALLLVVADSVARSVAMPAEVPVGIFTALIGGPGFLLLLRAVVRGGRAA